MMLNAVNLAFVTFSKLVGNLDGQVAVFFVMVIAAAESAIGLAIILSVFRSVASVETTDSAELKW
jgi:NADH-quinone oxidoreductase subunit K